MAGIIPSPSNGYTVPIDSPTPIVFFPSLNGKHFDGGVILTGRPTFLIIQIILGWLVIYSKLNPIVVASHLSTAVALFGMVFVSLLSVYKELKREKNIKKV